MAKPDTQNSSEQPVNPSTEAAAAFPEFDYTPNVVCKQVDDRRPELDVLTPKSLSAERAPALVYIHGGDRAGVDRNQMRRPDIAGVFHRCGAAGVICSRIEHRTNDEPATAFDCAVDGKGALRFLTKNADTCRIDPARIAMIGARQADICRSSQRWATTRVFPTIRNSPGQVPALRCEADYTIPPRISWTSN